MSKCTANGIERLGPKVYRTELTRLQREMVKLQEWVSSEGCVVERTNPRVVRVVGLPTVREHAHAVGHRAHQVLVLGQRR